MIELKGNELGWLIKLAEHHHNSLQFRTYVKKHGLLNLDAMLDFLMARFHPTHFTHGGSQTKWYLLSEEEYHSLVGERKR